MDKEFIIQKVLSNNVVISGDGDKLYVLIGKGIGFGRKKDDKIPSDKGIEQRFIAVENEEKENYKRILSDINEEIVAVTEEIISLAALKLEDELSFHIHIGLADHINFAIKRVQEGIDIINPFIIEIQTMYPKEYRVAEAAVDLIEKRLNIRLPEDEVGFITLHIYSARVNEEVTESLKYTRLVKETVQFIENELTINISDKSLEYARLISHLRYALYRIDTGKVFSNVLLSSVKRQLKNEYKEAKKICNFIQEKLDKPVPDDEVGYIAVHLGRLKNNMF